MSTPRRNTRCEKGADSFHAGRKRSSPAPFDKTPAVDPTPTPVRIEQPDLLLRHAARPRAGAGQSHPYAHAMPARAAPDTLFGEPGGLCFTLAPNPPRLGQARRARQALVRKSESSTKCGDCGDESGGDAQVSDIRSEFKRGRRRGTNCLPPRRVGKPTLLRRCERQGGVVTQEGGKAGTCLVMSQSRCGGDFPVILSETPRKNRRFCHSLDTECLLNNCIDERIHGYRCDHSAAPVENSALHDRATRLTHWRRRGAACGR